jgi:putative ABC transport system permease protein
LPGADAVAIAADDTIIGSRAGTSLTAVDNVPVTMPQRDQADAAEAYMRSSAFYRSVTGDFFRTMGIPVLEGRTFTLQDATPTNRVAVVSDQFRRMHFGNRSALGHRIALGGMDLEIVGVVGDVRSSPTSRGAGEVYLLPDDEHTGAGLVVMVRAAREPAPLAPAVVSALAALDPDFAPYDVTTMGALLDRAFVVPRFYGLASTTFAAFAFFLAAVGLYGLLAYSVASRRMEFGVRLALGGPRWMVIFGVMREGLALCVIGIVLGLFGAYQSSVLIEGLLFGITPHDPVTFVSAAVLFTIVSIVACYVPARRATQVDPIVALRSE